MKRMKASNLSKSTEKARERVIISAAVYRRFRDKPNMAMLDTPDEVMRLTTTLIRQSLARRDKKALAKRDKKVHRPKEQTK